MVHVHLSDYRLDPLDSKHIVSMQECGLHHRKVRAEPTWAFISHPSPSPPLHTWEKHCVCVCASLPCMYT